ncbi:GNAT family N-acetyltransferase [Amycolatopsis sp. NPDC051903]|uniref:GNAT family N-acetyltransferase n=1 Tax=Amycolatopsis sp. NPDC051903 TaxID=3363936 RepID=UPI0037A1CE7F
MATTEPARFAALDPLLPPPAPAAAGERVSAVTTGGVRVSGVVQRHRHGPGDTPLLWSAAQVWQLFPAADTPGTEGFDLLLGELRSLVDGEPPGADSACVVNWPSRDAEAIRAFLDHGLAPMSALAVRTTPPSPAEPDRDGVTVRLAGPADFDEVLALCAATFDYTGLVAHRRREQTAELLAPALRRALDEPATWLAEADGETVALAQCAWVHSAPDTDAAELLPPGLWAYVNNVVTAPGHRGNGVGRALMAHVHRELLRPGVVGAYLYYNPMNPLSSVFWHRQGYRPLWTSWEAHPASALR